MMSETLRQDTAAILARMLMTRVEEESTRPMGILLKDPPDHDAAKLVTELSPLLQDGKARLAYVGSQEDTEAAEEIATAMGLSEDQFASRVEDAEAWRNERGLDATLIVLAPSSHPKLTSLETFETVSNRQITEFTCDFASRVLNANEAYNERQLEWWTVLRNDRRQSLAGLIAYLSALSGLPYSEMIHKAANALDLLGLFPDPQLFDPNTDLSERLELNWDFIEKVKSFTEDEREKLGKRVATAPSNQRAGLQRIFALVTAYSEGDAGAITELTLGQVLTLWRYRPPTGTVTVTRQRRIIADDLAFHALLSGATDRLQPYAQTLHEFLVQTEGDSALPLGGGDESHRVVDLPLGTTEENERVIVAAHPKLRKLVGCFVNQTTLGGVVNSDNSSSVDEAIIGFTLNQVDEQSVWTVENIRNYLTLVVADASKDLLSLFEDMISRRAELVDYVEDILISPLLTLNSSPDILAAAQAYIEAAERFVVGLSSAHNVLLESFADAVNELYELILSLDTVIFRSPQGVFAAVLLPLHPLHLWRFVELSRRLLEQRERLSEDDRKLLSASHRSLPNFLNSVLVGRHITYGTQVTLFESGVALSGLSAQLPLFEPRPVQDITQDGLDDVFMLLRRFIQLYPHAQQGLRVLLIDPPDPGGILFGIATFAEREKLLGGLHVALRRTTGRMPLSLRVSAEQEQQIVGVFKGVGREESYTLSIDNTGHRLDELVTELPAHVIVIFDPSQARSVGAPSSSDAPLHPLFQPRRFQPYPVRPNVRIDLRPAPGGIFRAYDDVVRDVAGPTKLSTLAVHQDQDVRENLAAIARVYPWLVLVDRQVDSDLSLGNLRVFTNRSGNRDVVAFASSTERFRRILRDVVRRYNTAITDDQLTGLLTDLSDLLGDGVLSLISSSVNSSAALNSQVKGTLGTLIARRWFTDKGGRRLLISLDSPEARKWLRLAQDPRRADLVGITWEDGNAFIDVIEVKAVDDSRAEYGITVSDEGEIARGSAIDQLLSTAALMRQVFGDDRLDELLTTPARREIVRDHLHREISKRTYGSEDALAYAKELNDLFEHGVPQTRIRLILVDVGIGRSVNLSPRTLPAVGADGTLDQVTIVQLNETVIDFPLGQNGHYQPPSSGLDSGPTAPPDEPSPIPDGGASIEVSPEQQDDEATSVEQDPVPESISVEANLKLRTPILVGHSLRGDRAVYWDPHNAEQPLTNYHMIITGSTGSGKTQATKNIIHQVAEQSLPVLIIDFKDDYSRQPFPTNERMHVYDIAEQGLPFNPLELTPDQETGAVNAMKHIYEISGIIRRIFSGTGLQQEGRLRSAMQAAYRAAGVPLEAYIPNPGQRYPSYADVQEALKQVDRNDDLLARLSPLTDLQLLRSTEEVSASFDDLIQGNVVLRVSQLPNDEIKNLIAEFLLLALYNFLIRQTQPHRLTRLVVLDEAWRLVNSQFLEPLLREGRAFGVGCLIATQFQKDLSLIVSGSAATKLYFSTEDPRDIVRLLLGKTSGADAEQLLRLIKNLQPLQCLFANAHYRPYSQIRIRSYFESQEG